MHFNAASIGFVPLISSKLLPDEFISVDAPSAQRATPAPTTHIGDGQFGILQGQGFVSRINASGGHNQSTSLRTDSQCEMALPKKELSELIVVALRCSKQNWLALLQAIFTANGYTQARSADTGVERPLSCSVDRCDLISVRVAACRRDAACRGRGLRYGTVEMRRERCPAQDQQRMRVRRSRLSSRRRFSFERLCF